MAQSDGHIFRLLVFDVPLEVRDGVDAPADPEKKGINLRDFMPSDCHLLGVVHERRDGVVSMATSAEIGQSTVSVDFHGDHSTPAAPSHLLLTNCRQ